jgi:hypothetical protein
MRIWFKNNGLQAMEGMARFGTRCICSRGWNETRTRLNGRVFGAMSGGLRKVTTKSPGGGQEATSGGSGGTSKQEEEEVEDSPVKYTTTDAHTKWKAAYNWKDYEQLNDKIPPSQRIVVIVSTTIFLLYFLVLREESDLDQDMYKPLFENVPTLEKPMIENAIIENRRMGNPTTELEKKLQTILHEETLRDIAREKGVKHGKN